MRLPYRCRRYRDVAPDDRIRAAPDVLVAAQGDARILLDLRRERYYTLDAVGGTVWDEVERGATTHDVVCAVRRAWDAPASAPEGEDPVTRDVARLVRSLHVAGLVRIEPRPRAAHW